MAVQPTLAPVSENRFGIPCIYPKIYQAANAVGAVDQTTAEITMFVDTAQKPFSVPELGVYEEVSSTYGLEEARMRALRLDKRNSEGSLEQRTMK